MNTDKEYNNHYVIKPEVWLSILWGILTLGTVAVGLMMGFNTSDRKFYV